MDADPIPLADEPDKRLAAEVERLGDAVRDLADVASGQPERIFSAVSQAVNQQALTGQAKPGSLPPREEQHAAILGIPGAKKFGFTPEILAGMPAELVAQVYSDLPKKKPAKAAKADKPAESETDVFGFADAKDRVEVGPTYGFAPEAKPKTASEPKEPKSPAGRDAQAVLQSIDRGVWQLVSRSAVSGTSGKPEAKESEPDKPTIPGPIRELLSHTRIGRQVTRFADRVDLVRKHFGGRGGRKTSTPRTGTPKTGGATTNATSGIRTTPVGVRPPGLPVGMPVGAGAAAESGAAAGGAEAAAGGAAAAGMAVPVIGVIIAATFALVEMTKATINVAYAQEDHARKLAQFSPSQAANIAQLDMARIQRNVETGEATAPSSGDLTRAINRLEKAIQPLEILLTNLVNEVAAGAIEKIVPAVDAYMVIMKPLLDGVQAIAKLLGGKDEEQATSLGEWAAKVAREQDQKDAQARAAIDRLRRADGF